MFGRFEKDGIWRKSAKYCLIVGNAAEFINKNSRLVLMEIRAFWKNTKEFLRAEVRRAPHAKSGQFQSFENHSLLDRIFDMIGK
jgi:hypothetical protein